MNSNSGKRRAHDIDFPDQAELDAAALETVEEHDETTTDPELCRCGSCGSMLVQPIDWSLIGRSHWRVVLRCPNCEWSGTGVFGQEAVDRYDRELDRGTRKLQSTLTRVSRACLEAEIEAFAQALERDLIVPFDF
jgi:hypothetical protein